MSRNRIKTIKVDISGHHMEEKVGLHIQAFKKLNITKYNLYSPVLTTGVKIHHLK